MTIDLATRETAPSTGSRRRCIQQRGSGPRDRMIRFVVDPTGRLTPDLAERLPGRGVWLTADRGVIEKAAAGHTFARAVRRKVDVPAGLTDVLARLLRARCIETLGLARRSGVVVAGFDQVAELLRVLPEALLIVAGDASPGQRERLARIARAETDVSPLSRSELGRAFGRDELTYAAVEPCRLAQRLGRDIDRLAGVLGRLENPGVPAPHIEVEPPTAADLALETPDYPDVTAPAVPLMALADVAAGRVRQQGNEDDD